MGTSGQRHYQKRQRRHSQKGLRTKLLGVRLFPDEHVAFKDLADALGDDMSEIVYELLAEKYPHIFVRPRAKVAVKVA